MDRKVAMIRTHSYSAFCGRHADKGPLSSVGYRYLWLHSREKGLLGRGVYQEKVSWLLEDATDNGRWSKNELWARLQDWQAQMTTPSPDDPCVLCNWNISSRWGRKEASIGSAEWLGDNHARRNPLMIRRQCVSIVSEVMVLIEQWNKALTLYNSLCEWCPIQYEIGSRCRQR